MIRLPRKILHVDDDFSLREVMRAVFGALKDVDLITCENGRRALEQLQTFTPDLILLDLSMPDMDGPEFLRAMQGIGRVKGTPVILITQFGNITLQGNFKALGVIGLLHKPLNLDTLAAQISTLYQNRE
jgi:CheY-like chemotaxis protein